MTRAYYRGTPAERFAKRLMLVESGCIEWGGYRNRKGYGMFYPTTAQKILAHRFAWQIANGPIPEGMNILHRCDNPACVNAEHLFLGTLHENNDDMRAKGRDVPPPHRPGELNGHAKLTEHAVREIRRRYVPNFVTCRTLADEFGVSTHAVRAVLYGANWRHVR